MARPRGTDVQRLAQSFPWWEDLARMFTILLANGWHGEHKHFSARMLQVLGFKPSQAPDIERLLAEAETAGHVYGLNGSQPPTDDRLFTSRLLRNRRGRGYVPLVTVDQSEGLVAIDQLRYPDCLTALQWLAKQPYVILTGNLGGIVEPAGFPQPFPLGSDEFLDQIVNLGCVSPAFDDGAGSLICQVLEEHCLEILAAIANPCYLPSDFDMETTQIADVLFQSKQGATFFEFNSPDGNCGKVSCTGGMYRSLVDWLIGRTVVSQRESSAPSVEYTRLWPYFLADMIGVGVLQQIQETGTDYVVNQDRLQEIREANTRPQLIPQLLEKEQEARRVRDMGSRRKTPVWHRHSVGWQLKPIKQKGGKMEVQVSERVAQVVRVVHQLGSTSQDGRVTRDSVIAKLRDIPEFATMGEDLLVRQVETLVRAKYLYGGEHNGEGWCRVAPQGLIEIIHKDMAEADARGTGANNAPLPPHPVPPPSPPSRRDDEASDTATTQGKEDTMKLTEKAKKLPFPERVRLAWRNTPGETATEKQENIFLRHATDVLQKIFGLNSAASAQQFMDKLREEGLLSGVGGSYYWDRDMSNYSGVGESDASGGGRDEDGGQLDPPVPGPSRRGPRPGPRPKVTPEPPEEDTAPDANESTETDEFIATDDLHVVFTQARWLLPALKVAILLGRVLHPEERTLALMAIKEFAALSGEDMPQALNMLNSIFPEPPTAEPEEEE